MKKILMFIVTVFCIIGHVFGDTTFSNQTYETFTTNPSDPITLGYQIQVKYPKEWEIYNNPQKNSIFTVWPHSHDSMCSINTRVLSQELNEQDFKQFFQTNSYTNLTTDLFGLNNFVSTQTTLDKLPTAINTFSTYMDNLFFYHITSFIGYKNTIIVLKCFTFNREQQQAKISFDNFYPHFLYFINSFKLLNKQSFNIQDLDDKTTTIVNSIKKPNTKQMISQKTQNLKTDSTMIKRPISYRSALQPVNSQTNHKKIDSLGLDKMTKRDPHMNKIGYILGSIFGCLLLALLIHFLLKKRY
jgi:hypothetical protein